MSLDSYTYWDLSNGLRMWCSFTWTLLWPWRFYFGYCVSTGENSRAEEVHVSFNVFFFFLSSFFSGKWHTNATIFNNIIELAGKHVCMCGQKIFHSKVLSWTKKLKKKIPLFSSVFITLPFKKYLEEAFERDEWNNIKFGEDFRGSWAFSFLLYFESMNEGLEEILLEDNQIQVLAFLWMLISE